MDLLARLRLIDGEKFLTAIERIGKAGDKALKGIDAAARRARPGLLKIDTAVKGLRGNIKSAGEAGAQIGRGFGQLNSAFGRFATNVERTAKRIRKAVLLVTTAITASVTAAAVWADKTAQAAVDADKQGSRLGLSAREYQIWTRIVEGAGGAADDFSGGMEHLNGLVADAVSGGQESAAIFQRLGIRLADQNGRLRTSQEILGDVVDLFRKSRLAEAGRLEARGFRDAADVVEFATRRANIALELFGESGLALLPALNQDAAAINRQAAAVDRAGAAFSRADVIIGRRFKASLNAVKLSIEGVRNRIGIILAEQGIGLIDRFGAAFERNRDAIIAWAQRAIEWTGRFIADLGRLFSGQEASAANDWLNTLRDGFFQFIDFVQTTYTQVLVPVFTQLMAFMDRLAGAINAAFGTDLTGGQVALLLTLGRMLGIFQLLGPLVTIVVGGLRLMFSGLGLLLNSVKLLGAGLLTVFQFFGGGKLLAVITGFARAAMLALAGFIGWPALVIGGIVLLGTAIWAFWDDIVAGAKKVMPFLSKVWETVKGLFAGVVSLYGKLKTFFSFAITGSVSADAGSIPGRREGGLVTGPGTGTSDSILARVVNAAGKFAGLLRVSNGEGILNLTAMRNIGVAGLNALNAGFIPRFAEGGLIGGPLAAFAGADVGAASGASGTTLNLWLNNGAVLGLNGSPNALAKLLNSGQFALSPPNRWQFR